MVIDPMVGKCSSLISTVDNGSILAAATSLLSLKGKSILFKYPLKFFIVHKTNLKKKTSSPVYSFCEDCLLHKLNITNLQ